MAETLRLDPRSVVQHPNEQRQKHRRGNPSVGRHLDNRDDLEDVGEKHEHEDRRHKWCPAQPRVAHRLHDDVVFDEAHCALSDGLHPGGYHLFFVAHREYENSQNDGKEIYENHFVDTEGAIKPKVLEVDEVTERWEVKGKYAHACWLRGGVRLEGDFGFRPGKASDAETYFVSQASRPR